MKSPSCCNNIQAGPVLCVLCSLHTVAGFMMNNIGLGRTDQIQEARGTDGDGNSKPTTLTIPPVRCQPGICVSLY